MIDRDWKRHINLGIEIAVSVFVFVFSGYYIDKYFNTSPFGILAGVMVGIISVFYIIWKRYLRG